MRFLTVLAITLVCVANCSNSGAPSEKETPNKPAGTDRPVIGELTKAVIQNDSSRVARLLEMGADINENIGNAENRITPLIAAIALGSEPMANALLIRGASPLYAYGGYDAIDFADHLSLTQTLNIMSTWR